MTDQIAYRITHRITRITTLLSLAFAPALATGPALADDLEITHWDAELEWFLEASTSTPGATETFVVHATRLDDFQPVTTGKLTLQMHNRYGEVFSEATAGLDRKGIFAVPLTLPAPGHYYLTAVHEDADGMRESTLGQVHVPGDHDHGDEEHGHDHAADDHGHAHGEDDHGRDHGHDDEEHAHDAHDADDSFTFLKETQWRMRFATTRARHEPFAERIEVPGTVREVPGKRTRLVAPADGVITADGDWPTPGRQVNAGDSLMRLTVLPDSGTSSGLALDRVRARERLTAAEADLERLTALADQGVIADSRVVEARRERNTARAELNDARDRQERLDGSAVSGSLALRAPAGGRVESLDVSPGEVVQAGQLLARVLDGEALWLVAHLYPADLERVTSLADPAVRHPGSREWPRADASGHLCAGGVRASVPARPAADRLAGGRAVAAPHHAPDRGTDRRRRRAGGDGADRGRDVRAATGAYRDPFRRPGGDPRRGRGGRACGGPGRLCGPARGPRFR